MHKDQTPGESEVPFGRWEAQLSLPGGKRKSVYGKSRKEAREALNVARKKLDDGVDLGARRQTVGVFLDRWLEDVVLPQYAPKTYYQLRNLMCGHMIPELGMVQLDKLTAQQVAALLWKRMDVGLHRQRSGTFAPCSAMRSTERSSGV